MIARFRTVIKWLTIATGLGLSIRFFLIESFIVSSRSMEPTLVSGDVILASKFKFSVLFPFSTFELVKIRQPRVAELVVFAMPTESSRILLKRVVAIGGNKVTLRQSRLFIDGVSAHYRSVEENVLGRRSPDLILEKWGDGVEYPIIQESSGSNFGPIDVPADHFFVLSDSRSDLEDSRTWGPLPHSALRGKVEYILVSIDGYGKLRKNRVAIGLG